MTANAKVHFLLSKILGMNAATQKLAEYDAAHQDLGDDIAQYEANADLEPVTTEPPADAAKPRRTRTPRP
jgi:hypothetical protein